MQCFGAGGTLTPRTSSAFVQLSCLQWATPEFFLAKHHMFLLLAWSKKVLSLGSLLECNPTGPGCLQTLRCGYQRTTTLCRWLCVGQRLIRAVFGRILQAQAGLLLWPFETVKSLEPAGSPLLLARVSTGRAHNETERLGSAGDANSTCAHQFIHTQAMDCKLWGPKDPNS